jgi:hypothetical protein
VPGPVEINQRVEIEELGPSSHQQSTSSFSPALWRSPSVHDSKLNPILPRRAFSSSMWQRNPASESAMSRAGTRLTSSRPRSAAVLFSITTTTGTHLYVVDGSSFHGFPEGEHPFNRLYRNDGGSTFADVTAEAGVGDTSWSMAVSLPITTMTGRSICLWPTSVATDCIGI